MKPFKTSLIILAGLCFIHLFIEGCALQTTSKSMLREFKDAPQWVTKGCSSYLLNKTGENQICGIGSANNPNSSEALLIAKTRAKADISKKINTKITSILRDYQATTTDDQDFGTSAKDEQHIEELTTEITSTVLSGLDMTDSWLSKNGTLYVLVVLYPERFKESVINNSSISLGERKTIIENVDKVFREPDAATNN